MPSSVKKLSLEKPKKHEIEVTLFGSGVGECSVIHVGNDEWIIIDSQKHKKTGTPVALEYLASIGVDYSKQVKLVVITHWHQDHIGGISEIISACKNAKICFSQAYTQREFVNFLAAYTPPQVPGRDSRILELYETMHHVADGRDFTYAAQDTLLYNSNGTQIYSLSPSPAEITEFLQTISLKSPIAGKKKRQVPHKNQNHIGVVIWIKIGEIRLLLGADMEVINNPNLGWTAIIEKSALLNTEGNNIATLYKIAHHGSENGDHPDIWDKLLHKESIGILTPYARLKLPLPKKPDVQRILSKTPYAYITSSPFKNKKVQGRHPAVNRFLKSKHGAMRAVSYAEGQIRVRTELSDKLITPKAWTTECIGEAIGLKNLKKSYEWTHSSSKN